MLLRIGVAVFVFLCPPRQKTAIKRFQLILTVRPRKMNIYIKMSCRNAFSHSSMRTVFFSIVQLSSGNVNFYDLAIIVSQINMPLND